MDSKREECIHKKEAVSCGKCCDMSPKMTSKGTDVGSGTWWSASRKSLRPLSEVWRWKLNEWVDEEGGGGRKCI